MQTCCRSTIWPFDGLVQRFWGGSRNVQARKYPGKGSRRGAAQRMHEVLEACRGFRVQKGSSATNGPKVAEGLQGQRVV